MTESSAPEEGVRIQKVLSQAGIASRREAERLLLEGAVFLNGNVVTELGTKVIVGKDRIEVNGEPVRHPNKVKRVVYALYKPKNCVTTNKDPQKRSTIKDFYPPNHDHLFPVGRLDYDAEGLIFVTNDGEFANRLMHPRFHIWKGYFVKIKGVISTEHLYSLRQGPTINRKKHLPLKAKILHTVHDKTWLDVSLQEGTNQQIKKMFWDLGYRVQKIKRYSIGSLTLENLTPGQSRRLTRVEIGALLGESSS